MTKGGAGQGICARALGGNYSHNKLYGNVPKILALYCFGLHNGAKYALINMCCFERRAVRPVWAAQEKEKV